MFEWGSDLNFGLKFVGQARMWVGLAQPTDHTLN
jgi:hypothetical protein